MRSAGSKPNAGRRQRTLALLAFLLSVSPLATAWNAGAHRLAASIAWTTLDPSQRDQIWALLQAHPDFPHWRSPQRGGPAAGASPGDRLAVFVEAGVWADSIRDAADFDEPGAGRARSARGFPDRQRRRDWHYVNQPLGEPSERVLGGRLHQAIPRLQGWLADPASPYRSYALVWLLHLVADLHQPLHVSTRRLPGGGDDAGGNGVQVLIDQSLIAGTRHDRTLSLHRYWDALVAPPWLSGERLARLRERLVREHPRVRGPVDVAAWRAQSFALAAGAYRGIAADGRRIRVGTAAHRDNQRLAEGLVALAGWRLGDLLGAALAAVPESAETRAGAQRMPGEKFLRRQAAPAGALE